MKKHLLLLGLLAGCGGPKESIPLPVHQPGRVIHARDVGAADPDERIDLVISLKLRDRDRLDGLLKAQSDPASGQYHQYLSPIQFGEAFGPTESDYERVATWAESYNLSISRRSPSRTTLSLNGRIADVARAFGTEFRRYEDTRGEFRAPAKSLSNLAFIEDVFYGVSGLDDAGHWQSHKVDPPPAMPNAQPNGSRDPVDLQTMYQANLVPEKGEGQTIAILGTGYAPRPDQDVKRYVTKFALPTNVDQQYTLVFLGGPNRDSDALANNEYGENVLDIDMVLALAPKASVIHVHTATNSPGLFNDGIVYIVNNLPHAHQVSVSYGTCEKVAVLEIVTMNALFQQAKAQGQTWFFASGDNGTDGCRDGKANKVLNADWPSTSPYVIGVGGTQITMGQEVTWGGSGGGQSEAVDKPAYQIGVGDPRYQNDGVRQTPDVAALSAAPYVTVVFGTSTSASGGTSAAAPMWAAIWSLLNQRLAANGKGPATDAHERLYQLGKAASTAFHDITKGTNSDGTTPGYPAIVGYDMATGWGTPNTQQLLIQY
jgi:kumamolisin